MTFEEFLMGVHGKDYTGTDDEMPDAFEAWLTELDTDSLILLANDYGKELQRGTYEN